MSRPSIHLLSALAAAPALLGGTPASAQQQPEPEPPLEARIWFDRGTEPLLQRGDRVRMYYRTSEDAWVAVFHIDTDGATRLVFPRSPDERNRVEGGRDYRLLYGSTPEWSVSEHEGKGYFFVVASPRPLDFEEFGWLPHERTWDLSGVGAQVYQDPFLAMDDYVAALIPAWQAVEYGLDYAAYDVEEAHEYPRFLCYDCHDAQPYVQWNPYTYACTDFRVVVWDDPYFSPAWRYGPTRVVYTSALRGRARFGMQSRAPGEAWSPLYRVREGPRAALTQYKEPSAAAPEPSRLAPARRRSAVPAPAATDRSAGTPLPGGAVDGRRDPSPPGRQIAPVPRRGSGSAGAGGAGRPVVRQGDARGGRPVVGREREERERPTLLRRPGTRPTGPTARPPRGTGAPGDPGVRPSDGVRRAPGGVRPGSRPAVRPPARPGASGSSGRPSVRPPAARPGVRRPSARPGTGRPTVRPGTGRPTARPGSGRPTARPGSGRPTARPGSGRPTARPGSGRPTARPSSGRPTARPSSGRPATRPPSGRPVRRPIGKRPVRRKPGGTL